VSCYMQSKVNLFAMQQDTMQKLYSMLKNGN